MRNLKKLFLISFISVSAFTSVRAQTGSVQEGVVFKKGTNIRISNAEIINKNTRGKVNSNDFGIFRIISSVNDTLQISGAGYITQVFIVRDFKDAIIHLQSTNELQEVQVKEKTIKQELEEARNSYRSKGVFYKGKPPLLAAIFSPLTFINELVGKNGRQARRFNKFADREIDYYEVASRFNDSSIKTTVPIQDDELEDFKSKYWPTAEQIKRWTDYDVISYIKRSYTEFKNKRTTD
jgi:hypothetical protein